MTDAFASLRVTDVAFNDDFILMTLADGRRTRHPAAVALGACAVRGHG